MLRKLSLLMQTLFSTVLVYYAIKRKGEEEKRTLLPLPLFAPTSTKCKCLFFLLSVLLFRDAFPLSCTFLSFYYNRRQRSLFELELTLTA